MSVKPLQIDVRRPGPPVAHVTGARVGGMDLDPMVPRRDDPLPLEAVRDLLGLVRAIYAAEQAQGAGPPVLCRIERVGRLLSDALDLAASTAPGTVGHRAAWRKAEDAARAVGELVDALTPAERIVRAARGRVRR